MEKIELIQWRSFI